MSEWRDLVYPLGFIAALAFTGRFLIQWLASEVQQKSVVTRSFWQLSLIGNLLMVLHSILQMQYSVCVVQACNAVIAWRNLNLMEARAQQTSLTFVFFLLALAIFGSTGIFLLQGLLFFDGTVIWARSPTFFSNSSPTLPFYWHLIGFVGITLFASRFWIQWWTAEKKQVSLLNAPFWWLSLAGALLSILYFSRMQDVINVIGPIFGLIPYMRNLMLLRKVEARDA